MILANKLIEERKRNGWSQEELADMLGVSRQSVSKWESAGAIPDLQRIIQLAELFGVSTDYLLKDEMDYEPSRGVSSNYSCENEFVKRVSMEEANAFLKLKINGAPTVANAVSLCIISPVLVIILAALCEAKMFGITESVASGIGCTALFILIAYAVYMFITFGIKESHMEHLEREVFETEYGVTGMVKEKMHSFEPVFARGIAIGVVLCIVAVIPTVIAGSMNAPDYICAVFVAILLMIIAIGVNIIIRVSIEKSAYDTLLQEGEYSKYEKTLKKKYESLSSVYWGVVTAGYLAWSFITMRWDFTWIVWPVAGVLFGAVSGIARFISQSGNKEA